MIYFLFIFNCFCIIYNTFIIYYLYKRRQEDKDFIHFLEIKRDFEKGDFKNGNI